MKIGFTGSQSGLRNHQIRELRYLIRLYEQDRKEFHHGDCIGADELAAFMFWHEDWPLICHPPNNPYKRAFMNERVPHLLVHETLSYLARNHAIVNSCDLLIACPKTMHEVLRSGTWATIRYARKVGKKVLIIYPE
jgi:hypothetical protein